MGDCDANRKKAVVLLSGGMDSATVLAIAKEKGYDCYAMTFVYQQRHHIEIEASKRIVRALGIGRHLLVHLDLGTIGGSALTDLHMDVPKDRFEGELSQKIPITYVPARNTLFLSYALAWSEVLNAFDIFIGVNATDYSGYPDCRPEFIDSYEKMANLATAAAVENKGHYTIHTPIIQMTKAQIIQTGRSLGVDYGLTHSCYDPSARGVSCGHCDACRLRLKGFREAGLQDPLTYQDKE